MCSNISIDTMRSKLAAGSSSARTSAVRTSRFAGARASMNARCVREFEIATMRLFG
jgi:hypothetical protein